MSKRMIYLVSVVLLAGLAGNASAQSASNPYPADGATDVPCDVALSWTPGWWADEEDVYLGTDFDAVNNADKDSDIWVGTYGGPSEFKAGGLEPCTTYYWRVDGIVYEEEEEEEEPPIKSAADNGDVSEIITGDVWSFTTACSEIPVIWKGEPVPGADIYIELEPDDEPICFGGTDQNGDFQINTTIDTAGTFSINVKLPENNASPNISESKASGSRGGFAVGGFSTAANEIPDNNDVNIELYPPDKTEVTLKNGMFCQKVGEFRIPESAVPYNFEHYGFLSYLCDHDDHIITVKYDPQSKEELHPFVIYVKFKDTTLHCKRYIKIEEKEEVSLK